MTHQHAIDTLATERYLLDEMPELERYAFEEHFFECEACAENMRLADQLRQEARAVFAGAPATRPELAAAPVRTRVASVVLPWAAAAVLALGLGYQMQRAPGFDTATQVFAPIALRAATRGALPTITLPEGNSAVAMALEINGTEAGAPLTYSLIREDEATEVASGRTDAPAPGMPLIVLVPSARLLPSSTYVMRVTATGAQTPPLEYRFTVAGR